MGCKKDRNCKKKNDYYKHERYHNRVAKAAKNAKPKRKRARLSLDEEELSGTGLSLPPPPVELEISHDSEHGKENESDHHPLLIPAPQLPVPLSVSLPPSPPLTEKDFLPDGDDARTIDPCQDFYETDPAESDDEQEPTTINNIDFVHKENEYLSDCDEEEETLEVKLFKYQRETALPRVSMDKLLDIFRVHGHIDLPSDCRNLKFNGIKTEVAFETKRIVYIGIRESFKRYPDKCFIGQSTIELRLFVDGLPFGRSTTISFWSILMTTNLLPDQVSVIGLYCGPHPQSDDIFIKYFVDELNELIRGGYKGHNVRVDYFIADIPATKMMKNIVGHMGKRACHKCHHTAEFLDGRPPYVYIPQNPEPAPRTDSEFRQKIGEGHFERNGLKTPLEDVIGLNMIDDFLIDSMHTVERVIRRFLYFLNANGHRKMGKIDRKQNVYLVTKATFNRIGQHYATFKFPLEFNRQPRSFNCIELWKASEYRSFLLYGGDIPLIDTVHDEQVRLFRLLATAIRILCDRELCQVPFFNDVAEQFILRFQTDTRNISKSYNLLTVHYLKHLPEQVLRHGPLDDTSCFKYENAQKLLLKLYKPNRFHLESVRNHLIRGNMFESHGVNHINKDCGTDVGRQTIKFKHFTLKPNERDCFFEANGYIYKLRAVPVRGWVEAHRFRYKTHAYYCLTPNGESFNSDHVGVYRISYLDSILPETVDVAAIKYKYVVHPINEEQTVFHAYRLL